MSMTRKDFELIASVLNDTPLTKEEREKVVTEYIWWFSSRYPNFDSKKFRDACFANKINITKLGNNI